MAKKQKYGHRESFPRFFKADNELQRKVGTGTLDAEAVAKTQAFLDSVQVDVTPTLREHLAEMNVILADLKTMTYDREEFLPNVTKPLMNIKSLSGTFHEMMVCRVSAFMLTFLEDVRKLDKDIAEILSAYIKVTTLLLELKIKDETNPHGQSFLTEIRGATKRYYDKHAQNVRG